MNTLNMLCLSLLLAASLPVHADEKTPSRYGGEMVQSKDGKKVPTFTDHNVKLPSSDTNVIHGTGAYSKSLMRQQAQMEEYERQLNARNQQAANNTATREAEIERKEKECKYLLEPKTPSANHFDTYKQAGKSRTPTARQKESYAACMSGPEAVEAMNKLHEKRDKALFAEIDRMDAQDAKTSADTPPFVQDINSGHTLHKIGTDYIDPSNGTFHHNTGAGLVNTKTGEFMPIQ